MTNGLSSAASPRVVIITQARFGSTRLRGKVLQPLGTKTVLEVHLQRLFRSKRAARVCVATTHEPEAAGILDIATRSGAATLQGSTTDVLDRYYQAATQEGATHVVRVTSDCPLVDPDVIDAVIDLGMSGAYDYASNIEPRTYPVGMDVEFVPMTILERAWREATAQPHREHVTMYVRENSTARGGTLFRSAGLPGEEGWDQLRMTVDYPEDLELVRRLVDAAGDEASCREYVDVLRGERAGA